MLDTAQFVIGWACLLAILVIAVCTIVSTVAPNWHRMVAAYRGHPVNPAAPATPHVASTPSRRGVAAIIASISKRRLSSGHCSSKHQPDGDRQRDPRSYDFDEKQFSPPHHGSSQVHCVCFKHGMVNDTSEKPCRSQALVSTGRQANFQLGEQ